MSETNCKPRYRLPMAVMGIGCLLFALHAVARSQERADKGDKGFVPLFNGKDLSGWQTTGRWAYEPDGAVALQPPYGRRRLIPDYQSFLWSKATYDNFVLDLEFKIETGSSSGVFMRSSSTVQLRPGTDPRLPRPTGTRKRHDGRRRRRGRSHEEHVETGRRVESHDHHLRRQSDAGRVERRASRQHRPQ